MRRTPLELAKLLSKELLHEARLQVVLHQTYLLNQALLVRSGAHDHL